MRVFVVHSAINAVPTYCRSCVRSVKNDCESFPHHDQKAVLTSTQPPLPLVLYCRRCDCAAWFPLAAGCVTIGAVNAGMSCRRCRPHGQVWEAAAAATGARPTPDSLCAADGHLAWESAAAAPPAAAGFGFYSPLDVCHSPPDSQTDSQDLSSRICLRQKSRCPEIFSFIYDLYELSQDTKSNHNKIIS